MNRDEMIQLAERILDAWNTQDVDRVAEVYTEDVHYRDPNTRGVVNGREGFKRYLTKLFSAWEMTWATREAFPFGEDDGCAFLWRATLRKAGGDKTVEVDGMDLVIVEGDRIKRNEVYFDRAVLAALL